MSQIITKPWGEEQLLSDGQTPYTVKILKILATNRISLQKHSQKDETLVLFSGKAEITLDTITTVMQPLKAYHISRLTTHRIKALTDSLIFEVSSRPTGQTIRLQDDYHRANEDL